MSLLEEHGFGGGTGGWNFKEAWFNKGEYMTIGIAPMAESLRRINTTAFNDDIYLSGGFKYGTGTNLKFTKYNPMSNTYTILAQSVTPRASICESNGKIYNLSDYAVLSYNVESNTWNTLLSNPTGLSRSYSRTLEHNGVIFYIPGSNIPGDDVTFFKYDTITNTVTRLSNRPRNHAGAIIEIIGDYIYFMGGTTNTLNIYHIPTDSWTTGLAMPVLKNGCSSYVQSEKIYYMYGYPFDNKLMEYDPLTNSYKEVAVRDFSKLLYRTNFQEVGGKFYVFGGGTTTSESTSNMDVAYGDVLITK